MAASKIYPKVTTPPNLPGDQGTKNSHTQPAAIKTVGSPEQMRQAATVTSTKPLMGPASKVYPHLMKH